MTFAFLSDLPIESIEYSDRNAPAVPKQATEGPRLMPLLSVVNIQTVANRLSDITIQYEVSKNISSSQLENDELDDEIIDEEEFLSLC